MKGKMVRMTTSEYERSPYTSRSQLLSNIGQTRNKTTTVETDLRGGCRCIFTYLDPPSPKTGFGLFAFNQQHDKISLFVSGEKEEIQFSFAGLN
jgi:hypothetical protein